MRPHPTLTLDLSLTDVAAGVVGCLRSDRFATSNGEIARAFGAPCLASLTLRSAFDLYLAAQRFPRGSEILLSAITHPEMVAIVAAHGLVALPIDLDPRTMAPRAELLDRALSPRTKALVVAHLFGGRLELDSLLAWCRRNGVLLLEDCAQAFGGGYRGDARADAAFFSFGPIKACTAVGGAVACVRDARILREMTVLQSHYPRQGRGEFMGRLVRFALIGAALKSPTFLRLAARLCRRRGVLLSDVMRRSLKSFSGDFRIERLRRRPSTPLLRLLARRLRRGSETTKLRRYAGEALSRAIDPDAQPGGDARDHLHWIFPVATETPDALIASLLAAGHHGMRGLSNLTTFASPADRPELDPRLARRLTEQSVLVPMHAGLHDAAIACLAAAIQMNRASPRLPTPVKPS